MSDLLYCIFIGIIFPFVVFSYENVALNKSAWQQDATYNYLASRAVDGRKTSLSPYGPDCMTSSSSKTVEWRVDLEDIVSIHHIFIQFATNNNPWDENNTYATYFLGFSVYLSNTTHKEDGVLLFRDTIYTSATIPNPINIPCPHYGRYVIYFNNRTHPPYPAGYSDAIINALCEVEVYDRSYTSWANDRYFDEEIETRYILAFGGATLGVIILFCSALLVLISRHLKPRKERPKCWNESEERPPLNMPTQGMQEHLEDYWSNFNMNIYCEPSELNQELETASNYSIAQFPCSFGDHNPELNIYSYNHLHENPSQSTADVYDVVKAVS